jgi:hypothetical protein
MTDRYHGGVPTDRNRRAGRHAGGREFARFDHRGRITALVASGDPLAPDTTVYKALPIGAGPTSTDDGTWDGPAQVKNLDNDDGEAEFKQAFAWQDDDADPDTKAAYSFIHHFVDSTGKVGAASTVACSAGIGILNGGRGVDVKSADWYDDRQGIYNHLAGHLKAAGVKPDDVPDLDDMAVVEQRDYSYAQAPDEHYAALHGGKTVTHTHTHSAYGSQGADKTHSHQHTHNGDASHNHHKAAGLAAETVTPIRGPEHLAEKLAELRDRQAQTPDVERTTLHVLDERGQRTGVSVELPVRWDAEAEVPTYAVHTDENGLRSVRVSMVASGAFVPTLDDEQALALIAAGADIPQIVDSPGGKWQAYLCVEGVRTDEDFMSRELMPDSLQFPDLPVSLRLQVEDEGGHWGAVVCGRIDTMERVPYPDGDGINAILGTGVFGSDENGQTAQLLVEEQTQRFVSVDLRDMESEIVEVAINIAVGGLWDDCDDDDVDDVDDWWMRVTSAVIGAATIVARPALQQAVIVMDGVDLPSAPLALERAPGTTVSITASADQDVLAAPPAEWFSDPGFHVGDPRLVRQPDGRYACPLTVTPEGRVYGHIAAWGSEHTGAKDPRTGRGVRPPHSPTYDYFLTGSVLTAEGTRVSVGNITMGCGHATLEKNMRQSAAHYDGGYGAVQVCNTGAGEDDFGIWVAGAIRVGVTDEQVAEFESMGMSGDWRGVAGSREPHLIAVLAVPVPGFPVTRQSLVASASITDAVAIGALANWRTGDAGELLALTAAGRVQRMSDGERIDQLTAAVEILLGERRERRRGAVLDRIGTL